MPIVNPRSQPLGCHPAPTQDRGGSARCPVWLVEHSPFGSGGPAVCDGNCAEPLGSLEALGYSAARYTPPRQATELSLLSSVQFLHVESLSSCAIPAVIHLFPREASALGVEREDMRLGFFNSRRLRFAGMQYRDAEHVRMPGSQTLEHRATDMTFNEVLQILRHMAAPKLCWCVQALPRELQRFYFSQANDIALCFQFTGPGECAPTAVDSINLHDLLWRYPSNLVQLPEKQEQARARYRDARDKLQTAHQAPPLGRFVLRSLAGLAFHL